MRYLKERCRSFGDTVFPGTSLEALCFIVAQFDRQLEMTRSRKEEKLADLIADRIEEKFRKKIDRIRFASTYAEKNSSLALYAINTMLYETNADLLMRASGETMHEVLRQSEKRYQERLEYNKQVHDNNIHRSCRRTK